MSSAAVISNRVTENLRARQGGVNESPRLWHPPNEPILLVFLLSSGRSRDIVRFSAADRLLAGARVSSRLELTAKRVLSRGFLQWCTALRAGQPNGNGWLELP